jgi:hypothetical protein
LGKGPDAELAEAWITYQKSWSTKLEVVVIPQADIDVGVKGPGLKAPQHEFLPLLTFGDLVERLVKIVRVISDFHTISWKADG